MDTKICGYSSPLYKMAYYLHMIYAHYPCELQILSRLLLMQCKCCVNSCYSILYCLGNNYKGEKSLYMFSTDATFLGLTTLYKTATVTPYPPSPPDYF